MLEITPTTHPTDQTPYACHICGQFVNQLVPREGYAWVCADCTAQESRAAAERNGWGYIGTRNHVTGKPEALLCDRDASGRLSSPHAPSVDQTAVLWCTKEDAITEAMAYWGR